MLQSAFVNVASRLHLGADLFRLGRFAGMDVGLIGTGHLDEHVPMITIVPPVFTFQGGVVLITTRSDQRPYKPVSVP